jgi:hypothetical protein
MADDRTFTLIGNFTDNITPALEKINRSLAQTKRAFESFGSKRGGTDTLTKSIGKVIGAHKKLTTEVGNLRSEMQKSFSTIKEYNKLMGKAVGANKRMQQSTAQAFGQQARDIAQANAQLRQHGTLSRRLNRSSGGGGGGGGPTRRPPAPPAPPRAPRTPRMSGGYGGGGGGGGPTRRTGGGGNSFGEKVMEYSFAQRVSSVVEAGIMSGFQAGVSLFQASFKYIGDSFRERIEDQMTDLQAAGGNLSIAEQQRKQGKTPFVKNLTDSIRFTQTTNKVLDKLANDLPGSNQDYIEVGKRISDSVATLVNYNTKGAMEFAKQLQVGNEQVYKQQQIKGDGGSQDVKNTITTIIGELTKKTVIGGFGGSVGAGGIRGPNSLAGIMERIITNPEMTLAKVSKYASTFDPKVLNALKRAFPKLDEAGDDLLKRAKIVNEMLDEIANPGMIEASKRTVAGVLEAYRGAFFSPESGLLGFGRKLGEVNKGTAPMIDEMGRYIKVSIKDGQQFFEVVKTAGEATKENLSIFEMIGDLMANYGAILKPLVDNIGMIFDPLKQLGDVLQKARDYSIIVFGQFRNYAAGMGEIADGIKNSDLKNAFLQTKNFRASLLTLTNLFTNMGIFSEGDFSRLREILIDPTKGMKDLGKVFNEIVSTFFNSDAAKQLGEFFGTLLATIAVELSKMTGFFANKVGGGKLMGGFTSAFNAAGGGEAVSKIFEDIFKIIFDNLYKIAMDAPWQAKVFAGAVLVLPVVAQGLGFALASGLLGAAKLLGKPLKNSAKSIAKNALTKMKGKTPRITAEQMASFSTTLPNNTRSAGISNPSFRAIPRVARANPQFPNVALPGGVLRGVPGVTQPGAAPSIPKKLVNPVKPVGGGLKSKAASAAINGVFAFNNAVAGTGNVLKKVVKTVGKAGIAFTALDFGVRVATGENVGKAALGAGGALAGGAIGAVVGQALLPFLPGIGGIIGSIVGAFLGDWVATQLPALFANFPAKMTAAFTAVSTWFNEAPAKFGVAVGTFIADVQIWFEGLPQAFNSWLVKFKASLNKLLGDLGLSWDKFIASISSGGVIDWNKLGVVLAEKINGAMRLAAALLNPVNMAAEIAKYVSGAFKPGQGAYQKRIDESRKPKPLPAWVQFAGSPGKMHGSLGGAISSEMRNKPSGSDLVIANSSETVIPAAGGLNNGIDGLMNAIYASGQSVARSMQTGLTVLTQTIIRSNEQTTSAIKQSGANTAAAINQSSARSAQQNAALMAAVKAGGMGGGGLGGGALGGGAGGAGIFGAAASRFGLTMTSGYRPGDPGYHGIDRARDYSNSTGPTPQMMQFAQFLASTYGSNLKELIYTPLGFSIKNGQRVAPYAQSAHYNHVHVAYAFGEGNPAFFTNQKDAQSFENKLIPSNVKSITSNTGELAGLFDGLFGQKPKERKPGQKPTINELGTETGYKMLQRKKAMEDAMKLLNQSSYISPDRMTGPSGQTASNSAPANITNTITIQQLPGQDANQLAEIVARKIGQAISDVQASSLFV